MFQSAWCDGCRTKSATASYTFEKDGTDGTKEDTKNWCDMCAHLEGLALEADGWKFIMMTNLRNFGTNPDEPSLN